MWHKRAIAKELSKENTNWKKIEGLVSKATIRETKEKCVSTVEMYNYWQTDEIKRTQVLLEKRILFEIVKNLLDRDIFWGIWRYNRPTSTKDEMLQEWLKIITDNIEEAIGPNDNGL